MVTALGRRDYALNTDMVQSALKTRRMRPMFLVDVAVPGDVDPAINRIDAAFLYDLADLERIVSDGRASRETEAEAGRTIVAAEVAAYQAGRAGRAAVPAVGSCVSMPNRCAPMFLLKPMVTRKRPRA